MMKIHSCIKKYQINCVIFQRESKNRFKFIQKMIKNENIMI